MQNSFIQIFSRGFYQKYTKAFLFAFCMFMSYCLYMQTAGVFLNETSDYWTMFVVIKMLTEPIFAVLFCLFCFLYNLLCIRYITQKLTIERNQFLRYTFTGIPTTTRWKIWVITLFLMLLPLFVYVIFALGVGYYLAADNYGFLIISYLSLLNSGSAIYIDRFLIRYTGYPSQQSTPRSIRRIRIPFLLIPLVNHIYTNKGVLLVTKSLAIGTVYVFTDFFYTGELNQRTVILLALILACLHTILLYRDFLLQGRHMSFALNFPNTTFKRFIEVLPYYVILIFPEIIYILILTGLLLGLGVFAVSYLIFLLLFRSMILCLGNLPLLVSKVVLFCFFIGLFFILYQATLLLIMLTIIIAMFLFYKFFRCEKARVYSKDARQKKR